MRKTGGLIVLLAALLLAGCISTQEPPPEMLPPAEARQAQLTRLFDQLGSADEASAKTAAREAAGGDDRDQRFLVSLWGTRGRSPDGARRLGQALASGNRHDEALGWLERAYLALEAGDSLLPWLRYEMAREYLALGQKEHAVNLLATRLGVEPLPADLEARYDALLAEAGRG
ncbi:MAG: hypothetical protein IT463_06500 [Planctomycetes bacterium]|nr:hypothetical protein [Planctomycetota bacterium]